MGEDKLREEQKDRGLNSTDEGYRVDRERRFK